MKNEAYFLIDENAYIPIETHGWCEGKKCYEIGYLADGLCVACWDKQAEKRTRKTNKTKEVRIRT